MAQYIFQAGFDAESVEKVIALARAYETPRVENPHSAMASSKRIVDFIVETFAGRSRASIMAKRFVDGNDQYGVGCG